MSNFAWVTLATNDSYSLGALVVANSLKKVNTAHQTAVLITPGVSESMKSKLQATFNVVVDVNVLDSKDAANLALLSRPELGVTFTKLHCWRLTQFEKCVFLDADTFVLQNCDELFDREELSAAPDVGWPDCFNSGVFVFRPSLDTFGKLIEFATRQGSFDGGDQGLLNSFFSDWAHKDISKHLPFIYNTCSTACYSYLPAFKQFGQNVKILHFIGQVKPWLLNFDSSSKTVYAPQGYGHLGEYLQQWWNLFCADVHPALTKEMTTSAYQQYSHEPQLCPDTIYSPNITPIQSYPSPPQIEFLDPWDAYYQTNTDQTESASHDRFIEAHNVDHQECSHSEQNHEAYPIPHNVCEDHQSSHTTNANVDLQHTIDAPHISIRSSFIEESNVVESNANFHQTCNEIGDTSSHSINENSFLTDTHDNTQASTLVTSLNNGSEILDIGEHESESCQNDNCDGDIEDVNEDETTANCEEGGLAGALAQLTLGAPRSAEQVAYEESMRRQCWEAGNIDYLGKDSFDNIWARITKTIETKNDTPTTEKNRSPTPQPEETLAVETKKEVQVGPTLNESEEDAVAAAPAPIDEKIVTEVTPDGRIIEKKIVTYPGEEITEIEEIQEVDGQIVSVKRSVIGEETTAAQPKPKTLAEIKSEPIVLVPGHKTVEIDEKTNSTIVREKTTTGYQQTITTVQEDGTKKIQTKTFYDPVEIPGEEVEEETYEEIKTIEPGTEKTTVTTTTETTVASDGTLSNKDTVATSENQNVVEAEPTKPDENIEQKDEKASQDETKESKALTDLKNQPIVIVLGHQKVEFDKETNTTTVTEKTTTGYQQTLTTVTPDGRTIVQTKVFYDPISSEQVEEVETTTTTTVTEVSEAPITSEQVETVETTTTTTTLSGLSADPISSEQVEKVETTTTVTEVSEAPISSEQVETVETTTATTVTEVSGAPITSEQVETVGTTTTVTEVSEAPISSEEVETVETTTVTEVSQAPISSEQVETVETTTTTTVTEVSEAPISSEQVETVETTTTVTDVSAVPTPNESISNNTDVTITESKDVQLAVAAPIGETSLIQKKTTADGKEIEVTAVVSEDGKTKTLRKTTRQPSEEIEIEEYEETQSYEPGEVKVITTKKTVPIVEALEDAAKEITTEQITTAAKLTTVEQKQTIATKQDTSVVKPTIASDKQITTEESQITTEATDSKTETKQTVDATKITTEAKETITQAKETTTEAKEAIAKAKKTVDGNKTTTEVKQATTAAKQTTAEAKEAITKVKEVVEANKTTTEAKQALNEAKKTTTEAMQTVSEAKQTVDAKKIKTEAKETTTEAKETTTEAKQTSSSVKKTITGGKQGAVETKQIKKEDQTEPSVKKVTKPSDKDTKKTTPTVTVKTTTTIVKKDVESPKKTKVATDKAATTESTIIGEPKVTTKDGETITETVRRIPGGTEHTWTTVRADGSTKTESKTCFDVVELSSDEEWEEYEEIIEDDTIPEKPVTTKPKAPVAAGVKGPKTPTVTEATPPSTPPLKKLVIGSTSSALKAEHDIPDTPPLDKVEQLRKKKLPSAPASKVAPKVEKPAAEAPASKAAQKVDKPAAEAPASKVAPKVDKPAAEAPASKVAKKVEKPTTEAPASKVAPKVDKPTTEAPASKVAPKVDKPAAEAPKAPPRKKEVKTTVTGK